jgi:AraC-like DNA-binding protein
MTNNDKRLALGHPDPEKDQAWRDIIEKITDQLKEDEIPDNVVQATEYLLSGYTVIETAKEIGKSPATIRRWLNEYPIVAAVLADNRNMLQKWRMAQLEKQFLKAVRVSEEILDLSFDDRDVNPKIVGTVAMQARYIMGLFAGQKTDVTVRHELGDETMNATKDALDYIANQLQQQREGADEEPIEATYRVIDEKKDYGPLIGEDGNSRFGEIGTLDINQEGALCHVCGGRFKYLRNHTIRVHGLSANKYELLFGLDQGTLRGLDS